MNSISDRMKTLAGCVLKGQPAADIGTDHGLVPLYLIKAGICPSVILTDISESSLQKGCDNFSAAGCKGDFRCGNGISPLEYGEVSTVIIAGMGGELIARILEADINKAKSFKRLVLQPRKRVAMLRRFLYENGFEEKSESLVTEGPSICEIITAEPLEAGSQPEEIDFYLPKLLYEDPLLAEYLDVQLSRINVVLDNLENASVKDEPKLQFWNERLNKTLELRGRL